MRRWLIASLLLACVSSPVLAADFANGWPEPNPNGPQTCLVDDDCKVQDSNCRDCCDVPVINAKPKPACAPQLTVCHCAPLYPPVVRCQEHRCVYSSSNAR